jgi:hypothetical protein
MIVMLHCSALMHQCLFAARIFLRTPCSTSLHPFILYATSSYFSLHLWSPLQVLHHFTCYSHSWLSKNHTILFVMHVFLMSSPLLDHYSNSSSSLAVILYLFIISGSYPKILWLLCLSQLFIFSISYSQSIMASLASNPLPSHDHRQWPNTYSKGASQTRSCEC